MLCLVIGYGSIGKRHAQVLKSLSCDVAIVTAQKTQDFESFTTVEEALIEKPFEYIVIANATYLHFPTLSKLIDCDYKGVVLIEKPLFLNVENLPKNNITQILSAYNLRFCESLLKAREWIQDQELISFSVNVGQYLRY
jgi:predicted dehydrogenase